MCKAQLFSLFLIENQRTAIKQRMCAYSPFFFFFKSLTKNKCAREKKIQQSYKYRAPKTPQKHIPNAPNVMRCWVNIFAQIF